MKKILLLFCIIVLSSCSQLNEKEVTNTIEDTVTLLFLDYESGEPLPKQFIQVTKEDGKIIYEGLSDNDGSILLQNVEEDEKLHFLLTTPYGTDEYYKNVTQNSILVFYVYTQPYEINLEIPVILQNPSLPNGCEITALTAILRHYGKTVTKEDLSDKYLLKQDFYYKNGKKYGPDPNEMYAGNPRSKAGTYSFAEAIVNSANKYFDKTNSDLKARNISNSSENIIANYVENGIPVQIWVTLDLSKKRTNSGWWIESTNSYHTMITNLHSVVITNITNSSVTVMDPLSGYKTYNRDDFFKSYYDLGSQALIVYPGFLQEIN